MAGSILQPGVLRMNLSASLLKWYDAHRRLLPWRRSRDPYRIWISEVMLQQTRVETAIPYYVAFIDRFPTVESLAAADLDEVLALWSGLGYYRRARQLHEAARRIVARKSFPRSSVELQELPGIGPYTAAAVASQAFDEAVPVLDGNVERVLCRRLGFDQDPRKSAARRQLLEEASRWLDAGRPGDSNQALMELGATVCRPKGPDCRSCPLRRGCVARRLGDPERFPPPRRRRSVERIELAVAVAACNGRVLLFRRPEDSGFLAGMWELPNVAQRGTLTAREGSFSQRYGGCWRLESVAARVRHAITHRVLVLHVHRARFSAGETVGEGPEAAWVNAGERSDLPLSSMVPKVLDMERSRALS